MSSRLPGASLVFSARAAAETCGAAAAQFVQAGWLCSLECLHGSRRSRGRRTPVVILLYLPQPSKPVEHAYLHTGSLDCAAGEVESQPTGAAAHLKLSRVHAIVALYEGVPQVVDAELLQPLQWAVVKVQVVRVCNNGAVVSPAACGCITSVRSVRPAHIPCDAPFCA